MCLILILYFIRKFQRNPPQMLLKFLAGDINILQRKLSAVSTASRHVSGRESPSLEVHWGPNLKLPLVDWHRHTVDTRAMESQ